MTATTGRCSASASTCSARARRPRTRSSTCSWPRTAICARATGACSSSRGCTRSPGTAACRCSRAARRGRSRPRTRAKCSRRHGRRRRVPRGPPRDPRRSRPAARRPARSAGARRARRPLAQRDRGDPRRAQGQGEGPDLPGARRRWQAGGRPVRRTAATSRSSWRPCAGARCAAHRIRQHVAALPRCAAFEREVGRQRDALALLLPVIPPRRSSTACCRPRSSPPATVLPPRAPRARELPPPHRCRRWPARARQGSPRRRWRWPRWRSARAAAAWSRSARSTRRHLSRGR